MSSIVRANSPNPTAKYLKHGMMAKSQDRACIDGEVTSKRVIIDNMAYAIIMRDDDKDPKEVGYKCNNHIKNFHRTIYEMTVIKQLEECVGTNGQ